MTTRVKCLIRADKPTPNKNLYPREVLEKMIEEAKEKDIFVFREACQNSITDIVAVVKDIYLDEDGSVEVDIEPINEESKSFFDVAEDLELNSTVELDSDNDVEKKRRWCTFGEKRKVTFLFD